MALKVPADVRSLKDKVKGLLVKGPEKKESEGVVTPRTTSMIHKERTKRRELMEELQNEKTTVQRKQEIIEELQKKLDAAESQAEEFKTELERIKPHAERWSKHERTERARLIELFNPEDRKDARSVAESMDIDTFRKYTEKLTGASSGAGSTTGSKGKEGAKDWNAIMAGDPEEANKAIEADPDGFNKFMDSNPQK